MKKSLFYSVIALAVISVTLVVNGCSKEDVLDNDGKFPVTTSMVEVDYSSPIRLFTENGEIKNQAIIAEFVKGSQTFENQKSNPYGSMIHFISSKEMLIGDLSSDNNVTYQLEVLSSGRMQYSLIQVSSDSPLAESDYGMVSGTEILSTLPDERKNLLFKRTLYGNFDSFKLPMFRYLKVSRVTGGGIYTARSEGTALGEFDEDYIVTLQEGQSLAVQQVYATYEN